MLAQHLAKACLKNHSWAEISQGAFVHNIQRVQGMLAPSCRLMAVVKANAYGHGAVRMARWAMAEGASYLGVATALEAFELREAGIEAPILILSACPAVLAPDLARLELTPSVNSLDEAEALVQALKQASVQEKLKVHIKLDSGMVRLGFDIREEGSEASLREILSLQGMEQLDLEGIFTHFATAVSDPAFVERQFTRFENFLRDLSAHGLRFPLRHAANSAGLALDARYHLDMVRAGILLYGSSEGDLAKRLGLKPVMSLKSRLSQIREIAPATGISYGHQFVSREPMRIAVVECGYNDGLPTLLSGRQRFGLHGRLLNQLGRVCMDRCMLDIRDCPEAKVGDEVLIFGRQGSLSIDAQRVAETMQSIPYELFCRVGQRVPRISVP